jgi:hypothetical protein
MPCRSGRDRGAPQPLDRLFELLSTFCSRARIGTLISKSYAGPTSRFDLSAR